jgi:hypothetical protein
MQLSPLALARGEVPSSLFAGELAQLSEHQRELTRYEGPGSR